MRRAKLAPVAWAVAVAAALLGPAALGVPAGTPAAEDPLALAIRSVWSTGRPGPEEAASLARSMRDVASPCPDGEVGCEPSAWTLAAIAWKESGFRPWAVEGDGGVRGRGKGPGLGLYGLHRAFLPPGVDALDPEQAAVEAVAKAGRLIRHHMRRCGPPAKPHLWTAHWAAGFSVEGNERALVYALDVASRRLSLRRAGRAGPGD